MSELAEDFEYPELPDVPEVIREAWKNHQGVPVFVTVDEKGMPNAIYVSYLKISGDTWTIADIGFKKTRANIHAGSKGALLFLTKGGEAFQIKGTIQYHGSGYTYEDMQEWYRKIDPDTPVIGAVVLHVIEAYNGAEKVL